MRLYVAGLIFPAPAYHDYFSSLGNQRRTNAAPSRCSIGIGPRDNFCYCERVGGRSLLTKPNANAGKIAPKGRSRPFGGIKKQSPAT
jgi:hypothetical protein